MQQTFGPQSGVTGVPQSAPGLDAHKTTQNASHETPQSFDQFHDEKKSFSSSLFPSEDHHNMATVKGTRPQPPPAFENEKQLHHEEVENAVVANMFTNAASATGRFLICCLLSAPLTCIQTRSTR